MEKEDVKKLLMTMEVTFPNFKIEPEQLGFTLNAWYEDLKDFSSEDIAIAYKTYINTNSSPFAPSVSQLIGLTRKPHELAVLGGSEAWAMVSKAIRKGAYSSKEEFAKLPENIQRAVGSATQLHDWAVDENFNEGVVMSQFLKSYQITNDRIETEKRLPTEAKLRLEQIRKDNVALIDNNLMLLGQPSDKLQEGDYNYDEPPRPEAETIGGYSKQLRENLGLNGKE